MPLRFQETKLIFTSDVDVKEVKRSCDFFFATKRARLVGWRRKTCQKNLCFWMKNQYQLVMTQNIQIFIPTKSFWDGNHTTSTLATLRNVWFGRHLRVGGDGEMSWKVLKVEGFSSKGVIGHPRSRKSEPFRLEAQLGLCRTLQMLNRIFLRKKKPPPVGGAFWAPGDQR